VGELELSAVLEVALLMGLFAQEASNKEAKEVTNKNEIFDFINCPRIKPRVPSRILLF
jgi:hypothetical protein